MPEPIGPCSHCGLEDGGRKRHRDFGHWHPVCSDKCGYAYTNTAARWANDVAAQKAVIAAHDKEREKLVRHRERLIDKLAAAAFFEERGDA